MAAQQNQPQQHESAQVGHNQARPPQHLSRPVRQPIYYQYETVEEDYKDDYCDPHQSVNPLQVQRNEPTYT